LVLEEKEVHLVKKVSKELGEKIGYAESLYLLYLLADEELRECLGNNL